MIFLGVNQAVLKRKYENLSYSREYFLKIPNVKFIEQSE